MLNYKKSQISKFQKKLKKQFKKSQKSPYNGNNYFSKFIYWLGCAELQQFEDLLKIKESKNIVKSSTY